SSRSSAARTSPARWWSRRTTSPTCRVSPGRSRTSSCSSSSPRPTGTGSPRTTSSCRTATTRRTRARRAGLSTSAHDAGPRYNASRRRIEAETASPLLRAHSLAQAGSPEVHEARAAAGQRAQVDRHHVHLRPGTGEGGVDVLAGLVGAVVHDDTGLAHAGGFFGDIDGGMQVAERVDQPGVERLRGVEDAPVGQLLEAGPPAAPPAPRP